ncbi:MAG: NAD-dependent succinate-semialdehyde dehydrogenase [Sphingomonadales bacterium]|nr:NAD-dependent succinate-semialdehyde dehydrogenase [Sphingomonadales bacterium]
METTLAMYIDGHWITDAQRETIPVVDPARAAPLGDLPCATAADLDTALEAADKGFRIWKRTPPAERATVLKQAAQLIRDRAELIGETLTLEQGKPIAQGIWETSYAADIFDWFAEEGKRAYGRLIPGHDAGVSQMLVYEPVGPSLGLTPWNFPAFTPAMKIAAALAAGCSMIIKASEETPGTCIELVRACADAGLPAGVLNIVFGDPDEIARNLIASPVIRKVSFTGSVPVGVHLLKLAAEGVKRVTMELGGCAPAIICGDANVEDAADKLAQAKFTNAGQICVSPQRFFVEDTVYDAFAEAFVARASSLKIGPGIDPASDMGALANPRRLDAMEGFIADATAKGATLLSGGARIGNEGYFFAPTVLSEVPDDARLMREEVFGPVAALTRFGDFDDLIARASGVAVGLSAYAFTASQTKADRFAAELEAGLIGINNVVLTAPETPYEGLKQSGFGAEGGTEGLVAYLAPRLVTRRAAA